MTKPPKLGPLGTHSMPPLSDDDQGDIAIGIAYDPIDGVVLVNFGSPVAWIGFPPEQAIKLGELLIAKAREKR